MDAFWADVLLAAHFAIAVFIALGLPLVWIGARRRWAWVRNRTFRYAHAGAIVFVALETLAGYACPLTLWEDALRGADRPQSFVGRGLEALLYYRAPEWVFALLYAAWAAATLYTLARVPPRKSSPR